MSDPTLITLTAEIVSAYLSNNRVTVAETPAIIRSVHVALSELGKVEEAPRDEKLEPAVPVRSSVRPDAIACLVCGARHKMLKRHLARAHNLTPTEYRRAFDLKTDYPMVAPDYSTTRKTLAHAIGLGRKRTPADAEGEVTAEATPASAPAAKKPGRPRKPRAAKA